MSFYPKPSDDLVFDLINKANPGLPSPLSYDKVRLGVPKPISGAGPADLNTKIIAASNRSSGYVGTRELSYRRINLGSFFFNTVVLIEKFVTGGQPGKFSDFLSEFNMRYGFDLSVDDFVDGNFSTSTTGADGKKTATVTINTKPDSLGFVGSFLVRWKEANRELSSIITKSELPGRIYPADNFVNLLTYYGDNTELFSTPVSYQTTQYPMMEFFSDGLLLAGPGRPDIVSQHKQFVSVVNLNYGTSFICDPGLPQSEPGNLYRALVRKVSLPSAAYPTANSNQKHLLVLELQPEHTWGTGGLFFHHNYGV